MIMAVLATMAWQGIDAIVRSRDIAERQLQQSLRLNTVLAQWEQDLAALQETPVVPALNFDGASLRLTRRTAGGMQVVVWSLRAATLLQTPDGNPPLQAMVWQRWAGPVVTRRNELQEQLAAQPAAAGQRSRADPAASTASRSGRSISSAAATGPMHSRAATGVPGRPSCRRMVKLPSGVRIVIELAPGQARQGRLTRDIVLGPQPG